jgi:hypothetical protein
MRPRGAEVSTRRESRWQAVWVPVTTVTEYWRETTSGATHVRAFDDRHILHYGPLVRVRHEIPFVAPAQGAAAAPTQPGAAVHASSTLTEDQYLAMPGVVAWARAEWL